LVPTGLPNAFIDVPAEQHQLLADPRAGSVRISVKDSGAGLSPEQLAEICTEGTQFNANQLQAGGGSGLGLYISKGLAEQHGGTLTVASEGLGKGSTFTLELPLFKSDFGIGVRTESSASASTPTRSRHFSSGSSALDLESTGDLSPHQLQRILVVDDANSNRKLLIRILTAKGYMCYGAEDGQQAVDTYMRLRSEGVHLEAIVMDFEMPVMNGPTATKLIRDLGCTCFIAGVTGNVLPVDVDFFRSQGANVVIAKPLNVDVFESNFSAFRFALDRAMEDDSKKLELSEVELAHLGDSGRSGDPALGQYDSLALEEV
jgi:CheY-like chemotaxis protein